MPAAGAGRRFGSAKQYARLGASTVLDTALRLFIDDVRCEGGALVLAHDDPYREELARRLAPRFIVVTGGDARAHSVRNGLAALCERAGPEEWVLVHDAARPCLSAADLTRLLEHGCAEPAGALLAVPIADTIKRADTIQRAAGAEVDQGVPQVAATLSREALWLAQTPQMFRRGLLQAALERAVAAQRMPTDEAQAIEWEGFAARLVQTRDGNPKITSVADLAIAEAILAARSRSCA